MAMTTEVLMKLADVYALHKSDDDREGNHGALAPSTDARQALLDAMQSQAERIKELEAEAQEVSRQHVERLLRIEAKVDVLIAERDNLLERLAASQKEELSLRAQLAALQSDDELPELPHPSLTLQGKSRKTKAASEVMSLWNADFMQAYARQAQAMVRAKMVPLEKDAARYRILRDDKYQHHEDDVSVSDSNFTVYFGAELDAAVDALEARHTEIDAAMGITGEPK